MTIAQLMSGTALARSAWSPQEGVLVRRAEPAPPPAKPEDVDAGDGARREDDRAVVERIESMRSEINASARTRLTIEREGDKGRFIYKILDPDTGEMVRQWPPEKYLDLVAYLREQQGGLVDERV